MKHFFVIGNKTSKSLSPLIFNHWFRKYKIKANYAFVEVDKKNFDKTISRCLQDKRIAGLNVTIPFKKDIIKYVDEKNNHSQKIGAVNCVTINKKIKGVNTDWLGYLNSVKKFKIKKNNKIVILGFGGASKAIVYAFFLKGFKNIFVFNRSKKIINFGEKKKYSKTYGLIDKHLINADLIINTTPTNPLSKKQNRLVNKQAVISDIVYAPRKTPFLNSFKENKKIYGISMLIEQAILSFDLWFGFKPKVDSGLIKKLNLKIK